MIISHRNRYVFIEKPNTGCTAISSELQELYDGESVLHKHASLAELYHRSDPDVRSYIIACGIRNPLDIAVSRYFKLKTNHKGNYSNPSKAKAVGGWVRQRDYEEFRFVQTTNATFAAYFSRFYRNPHSEGAAHLRNMPMVLIRFEAIQDGFGIFLARCGLTQVRTLPVVNRTRGRVEGFEQYYTPGTWRRAARVFGPYMTASGYWLPSAWKVQRSPLLSRLEYGLVEGVKLRMYTADGNERRFPQLPHRLVRAVIARRDGSVPPRSCEQSVYRR